MTPAPTLRDFSRFPSPHPIQARYTCFSTTAISTSRKEEGYFSTTTMLVVMEASTATHVHMRHALSPISTLIVSSPRPPCLTSLYFDLRALSQQFYSLQFIWSIAISLSGQSVFNTYDTASSVFIEAESGGAMRGKSKNPLRPFI